MPEPLPPISALSLAPRSALVHAVPGSASAYAAAAVDTTVGIGPGVGVRLRKRVTVLAARLRGVPIFVSRLVFHRRQRPDMAGIDAVLHLADMMEIGPSGNCFAVVLLPRPAVGVDLLPTGGLKNRPFELNTGGPNPAGCRQWPRPLLELREEPREPGDWVSTLRSLFHRGYCSA